MALTVPVLKVKNITKMRIKRKGSTLAYLKNRSIAIPPIRKIITNGIVKAVYWGRYLYTTIGKRIPNANDKPQSI